MKPELILEALSNLDPENKDHWTQNGQPLLSAVGEGVTRQQVLDVAPLFSRENPILETEPALSDEEVKDTIANKLTEIELARIEANETLVEASALRAKADKMIQEANTALESLREEQKAMDPRTDAEINRDLLKSSLNERLRRAGAQTEARKLLEQAGLISELKALSVSPVDRAIAERVIKQRREQSRKGK